MTHELKILPKWYADVESGKKNFEIRVNDRDYKVGDTLVLQEYDKGNYTGRKITRKIQYIYQGNGAYSLSDEYCILGLEQEPCENCISRQEVFDLINDQKDVFYSEGDRSLFESYVSELSPVTPQPKTGHWIRGKYTEDDIRYNDSSYKCSECGRVVDTEENYCPNCGAKMER